MSVDATPDWSREFDDPIELPDGGVLRTLHDAGHYATTLLEDVQQRPEWQTAAEMLIMAAKGERPVMFANIAVRQALHAGEPAPMPTPWKKSARKHRSPHGHGRRGG